jgi:DNA replication protein DnaC
VLTENSAPSDWYQLSANPVGGESTLERLINTSNHLVMEGRSYRPNY